MQHSLVYQVPSMYHAIAYIRSVLRGATTMHHNQPAYQSRIPPPPGGRQDGGLGAPSRCNQCYICHFTAYTYMQREQRRPAVGEEGGVSFQKALAKQDAQALLLLGRQNAACKKRRWLRAVRSPSTAPHLSSTHSCMQSHPARRAPSDMRTKYSIYTG